MTYNLRLVFYILTLIRALLHHLPLPKVRLMQDPDLPSYLISLLSMTSTDDDKQQLQNTLYSLLTAVLRDEPDYKR